MLIFGSKYIRVDVNINYQKRNSNYKLRKMSGILRHQDIGPNETTPLLISTIKSADFQHTKEFSENSKEIDSLLPFGEVRQFADDLTSYTRLHLKGKPPDKITLGYPDSPQVQLIYVQKGRCQIRVGKTNPQRFYTGNCILLYLPSRSSVSIHTDHTDALDIVFIHLNRSFFLRKAPNGLAPVEAFKRSILQDKVMFLNDNPLQTTPQQAAVLYEILQNKRQALFKPHYINLKTAELLMLQLEFSVHMSNQASQQLLREEELQRIYQIRDKFHRDPGGSYSLVGLAREVGTNDATLKKHFKQVFGTTVFNYLTACRMELAKALLIENRESIAAVAHHVGFKYSSHFSSAFRKYYGYSPKKLL